MVHLRGQSQRPNQHPTRKSQPLPRQVLTWASSQRAQPSLRRIL